MKNLKRQMVLAMAAVSALTGTAFAGQWMNGYYNIARLENGDAENAYHVYMPMKNPKGCANTDYYEIYSGASIETRELMNRTLLSALMAGKKVRLNISTASCGANGRPAYTGVEVASDQ